MSLSKAIKMTIAERVEATLFGDVRYRDGDFESVAADVLDMPQAEVDAEIKRERAALNPSGASNE